MWWWWSCDEHPPVASIVRQSQRQPGLWVYAGAMVHIRLLGSLGIDVDGLPVELPASRRAQALLGWLVLHPGRHSRASLAGRFWPDVLDASARASLRSAVWALRRSL